MKENNIGKLRRGTVQAALCFLFLMSVSVLTLHYFIKQNPTWFEKEEKVFFDILNEKSAWRYMEEGKDPSVGKVWTTLQYDASFWKIGYGSFGTSADLGADNLINQNSGGQGDVHSYFFRHEFEVGENQAEEINSIAGAISYKDAVVVYLNGSVIFTGNIPSGSYETNLEAGAAEETDEIRSRDFKVTELSALQAGKNVLSVEIHQSGDESSDIYFAFPSFALSENVIEEKDYEMRHLVLTKGKSNDEIYVNYVSSKEEPYRVEYVEAANYTDAMSFAKYGNTEYMGSRRLEEGYIHKVKLKRLKENMDYVYRIIRVGDKDGSDTFRFSTGKNYKAVFGVTALPDSDNTGGGHTGWVTKAERMIEDSETPDFIAVLGEGNGEDTVLSDSKIWRQNPAIYVGVGTESGGTLVNEIFGSDNFYLTNRDITVIGIHDAGKEDIAEYIRQARQETQRTWVVVLTADLCQAKAYFDVGADVVMQRTRGGTVAVDYKNGQKTGSCEAGYVEVIGHGNQLEVRCYDDTGAVRKRIAF